MIDEKDIPEEVKGGLTPEIDPQKLFDEKEYSTIILGSEDNSKKDLNNADFITIIVSPKTNREEKDEALIGLKENQAQTFMISAITKSKKPEQKAAILAACWETGLDFSKDYQFFVNLIATGDFTVSFEAFTVIQEMEAEIPKETLAEALAILQKVNDPGISVTDAIELIEGKLNAE